MGVGLRLMLLVFFHSSTYGHENSKRLNATIRILARDVLPKRASKQPNKQINLSSMFFFFFTFNVNIMWLQFVVQSRHIANTTEQNGILSFSVGRARVSEVMVSEKEMIQT